MTQITSSATRTGNNWEGQITIGPYNLTIAMVDPKEIDPTNRFRQVFDDGGELENSIKEHGILQSLLVQFTGEEPTPYRLLAGGRRHKVASKLGLGAVPVLISIKELDELDIRTIELVENLHRRPLTYEEDLALKSEVHKLQTAKFGTRLRGGTAVTEGEVRTGWTLQDTANLLGTSKATISQDLKLAKALEKFPELRGMKDKKAAAKALEGMIKAVVQEEQASTYKQKMQDSGGPKQKLCDSYIIGDFFDRVKQLPENAFDFVEIDPFYGIELLELYSKRCCGTPYVRENYTDVPPEAYLWYIQTTLKECFRVMSDNSWGICWFAFEPWFEPTYQAIRDAGFYCRRVPGFWIQPAGASYNANLLLANTVDSFFYFRKGVVNLNSPGKSNSFLCAHVPPSKKIHPTERPVELYMDILPTFIGPNSKMFVPFVGSGNQLLAAANLNIHAVGFDLCEDYKNGFIIRVNQGDFGHYRSFI